MACFSKKKTLISIFGGAAFVLGLSRGCSQEQSATCYEPVPIAHPETQTERMNRAPGEEASQSAVSNPSYNRLPASMDSNIPKETPLGEAELIRKEHLITSRDEAIEVVAEELVRLGYFVDFQSLHYTIYNYFSEPNDVNYEFELNPDLCFASNEHGYDSLCIPLTFIEEGSEIPGRYHLLGFWDYYTISLPQTPMELMTELDIIIETVEVSRLNGSFGAAVY